MYQRPALGRKNRIVELLREGNGLGRERLVKEYSAPLYGIIFRLLGCPVASGEILEKCLIKICDDIPAFDYRTGFFTWMARIARKLSAGHPIFITRQLTCPSLGQQFSIFELVCNRGLSIARVASVLNISAEKVSIGLRKPVHETGGKFFFR